MTSSPAPGAPKTPWFSGRMKPVRVGEYERRYYSGSVLLCKWDGRRWLVPQEWMKKGLDPQVSGIQSLPWRGLSKEPK